MPPLILSSALARVHSFSVPLFPVSPVILVVSSLFLALSSSCSLLLSSSLHLFLSFVSFLLLLSSCLIVSIYAPPPPFPLSSRLRARVVVRLCQPAPCLWTLTTRLSSPRWWCSQAAARATKPPRPAARASRKFSRSFPCAGDAAIPKPASVIVDCYGPQSAKLAMESCTDTRG